MQSHTGSPPEAPPEVKKPAAHSPAVASHIFTRYNRTRLQVGAGILGYMAGLFSALYEYNLSIRFAEKISSQSVRDNPYALVVVQGIFAIPAYLPTVGLLSPATRDYFMDIVDFSDIETYAPATSHPVAQKMLWLLTDAMAWMSTTPFVYQLAVFYKGNLPMQILTALGTLAVCFVTSKMGTEAFYLQRFLNTYGLEAQTVKQARVNLAAEFQGYLCKIYLATDPAIDHVYSIYIDMKNNQGLDKSIFELLNANFQGIAIEEEAEETRLSYIWAKCLVDFISVALGTAASYTFADLTLEALAWIFDHFNLEGKDRAVLEGFAYPYAVLAVIPVCLFLGSFAQMRCNDYWNALTRKNHRFNAETSRKSLRSFINHFSLIIGAFAAATNVDLSLEEGDSVVGIPFAFAGLALAQAKAIDLLMQEWISAYDGRFASGTSDYKRDSLIYFIVFLTNQVQSKLSSADVFRLDSMVQEAKPSANVEAKQEVSPLLAHHFHARSSSAPTRLAPSEEVFSEVEMEELKALGLSFK